MGESSLKQRTISGVQWSLIEKVITTLTSFIYTIILVRILGPTNYGIIGIVSIFIFVIQGLVDSGFSAALIRKESVSEDDYSTAFFFNLVISITLYLILFFSAPLISVFFKQEMLIAILRVMGVVVIINAISITQLTKLSRNIDFKTQAKVSIISSVLAGFTGVIMALSGLGVWSIVGQQLVLYLTRCILFLAFSKWIPSLKLSKDSFRYLFGFGWKISVSNLISSIWVQGNKIIIGRMYDPATLGFYTRAKDLPHQVISSISSIINNVSFPALSTLQKDTNTLKNAYRRILKITFYLSSNIALGVSAIALPLIYVLYGGEWIHAAKYLQIVSLSYLFSTPIVVTLSMLKIKNRTDLFLRLEVIAKTVAIIPFVLGIKYGIMWLIWGGVGLSLFQYILDSYYAGKLINYSLFELIVDLLPSIGISLTMFVSVKALSLIQMPYHFMLPILIATGVIVVIFLSKVLNISEYKECINFAKILFQKVSRKK